MTEEIKKIDGVSDVNRNGTSSAKGRYKSKISPHSDDRDTVDISEEARKRSSLEICAETSETV